MMSYDLHIRQKKYLSIPYLPIWLNGWQVFFPLRVTTFTAGLLPRHEMINS